MAAFPVPTQDAGVDQAATTQRKRRSDHAPLPRQDSNDPSTLNQCPLMPNSVSDFSCFPESNSQIVQNIWTRFVWNTALPQFSQTNLVDIYLFHADSGIQVANWTHVQYLDGHLLVQPDDAWLGAQGQTFSGQNKTQPFFFRMVPNLASIDKEPQQATFTMTQTTFANSVIASMSSSSAAAASSSRASASSASAAASSSRVSASSASASKSAQSPNSTSTGALQNGGAGSNFPHWAIALLAVFGFLAVVALLAVLYLVLRHLRSRRNNSGLSHRHSMGSQSPMMADVGTSVAAGPTGGATRPTSAETQVPAQNNTKQNVVASDGASTVSRADSAGGLFSQGDAAAMAAAFRNVMRKPDFADRPMEEGESPEAQVDEDVLNRELAEEGRDIRSVGSSRGVRVENVSESGEGTHSPS